MATFGLSFFGLTYFGPEFPMVAVGASSSSGGHGAGILWIMDKGGGNPIQAEHAGAKIAWEVNGAGACSVFIKASTARALGAAGMNWIDTKWVKYQLPGVPDWGGVITEPDWTPGWYEIVADGFLSLGRDRRVPLFYGTDNATAGQLAQTAWRAVQSDDWSGLFWGGADETGETLTWQWRGGDFVDDVLAQLAQASLQEYQVDANRNLVWRVRIGRDRTGTVQLTYGQEIVDYRYTGSAWTIQNDIQGQASDTRHERSANLISRHGDSVRSLRAHETSIRYAGVVNKETLRPLVSRDLKRYAWPAETMTLTVSDIQHGWGRYHIGDTVLARLPEANAERRVRILSRSIDVDAGTELLAVEVEHEEDGW